MPEQNLQFDADGVAVLNLGTAYLLHTGIFYNPNPYDVVAHFESLTDNGFPLPTGCVLEIGAEDTLVPTSGLFIGANAVYFVGGSPGDVIRSLYTLRWWGSGLGSQYAPSASAPGPSGGGGAGGGGGGVGGGGTGSGGGGGGGARNI